MLQPKASATETDIWGAALFRTLSTLLQGVQHSCRPIPGDSVQVHEGHDCYPWCIPGRAAPPPPGGMGQGALLVHQPLSLIEWPTSPSSQHCWGCLWGGNIGTGCSMHPSSWAGLWYRSHQWYLALQCSGNTEASPQDLPRPLFCQSPMGGGLGPTLIL